MALHLPRETRATGDQLSMPPETNWPETHNGADYRQNKMFSSRLKGGEGGQEGGREDK